MNNPEEKTELIIKYLDGDLSENERIVLESELKTNSALKQEFENMKLAERALKHYGLRAEVAALHRDIIHKLKQPKLQVRKNQFLATFFKVAAVFIIALFLGLFYKFLSVKPENTFNEQYIPYTTSDDRGNSNNASSIEYSFKQKHYSTLIEIYNKATNKTTKEKFLTAQAYLQLKQPSNASMILDNIIKTEGTEGSFHDDAEYYLALSHIAEGNFSAALKIFKHIYDDKTHVYHEKVSVWTLLDLKILALKK